MTTKAILLSFLATSLLSAEPEKLINLRGSYEAAMIKATAPIQKTYIAELGKLKIEFTKSGDLDAAIAVDAELKQLAGHLATPSKSTPAGKEDDGDEPAKWLVGIWRRSATSDIHIRVSDFRFNADSSVEQIIPETDTTKVVGKWSVEKDKVIFSRTNGSGFVDYLTLKDRKKTQKLVGVATQGSNPIPVAYELVK